MALEPEAVLGVEAPRLALERLGGEVLRERARAIVEDEEERLRLQLHVVLLLRRYRRSLRMERQIALHMGHLYRAPTTTAHEPRSYAAAGKTPARAGTAADAA